MVDKKLPNKKLISEIFGEEEVKNITRLENFEKTSGIISNYVKSLVEIVKEDCKDKKGAKLVEELYQGGEKSKSPNFLVCIVCENDQIEKKMMMKYTLQPVVLEISFLEDADGTIDKFTSKIDYEIFDSEKKLREKCEKVIAKHFLVITTLIDKMISGDKAGLVNVANNLMKKYKNAEAEFRSANSNQKLNSSEFLRNMPDSNGFSDFIKSIM